jgi:uncharacterized protein (DUF433 family)
MENSTITKLSPQVHPSIGEGIYFPIDVALILKLDYHKVRYLMNTFWKEYTFGEKRNKAINFFSLIEFYTYYHLRENGFTSRHIKDFHQRLAKALQIQYPFASIKVLDRKSEKTSKSKIWFDYKGELMRDDRAIQPTIATFIKPFLKQVVFDQNEMAHQFFPFTHTENIIVDPRRQFGQPVINGTNIQTKTIYRLSESGETKANICKMYDINEKQVTDAIRLHSRKVA